MLDTVKAYIADIKDTEFTIFYQQYVMDMQDLRLDISAKEFQSKIWSIKDVTRGDVVVSAITDATKELLW